MKCREIRLSIPDYVRGTIDAPSRDRIDEHLGTCVRCSAETREMKNIMERLGTLREIPPSDLYWNTIVPRLHERMRGRSPHASVLGNIIPVALTVSLMLGFIFVFRVSMDTTLLGLRDTLRHSQPEDLQMITDQQSISGISETIVASDDQEAMTDKESLIDILAGTPPVLANGDEEVYISLDNFSDQEIQKIVSAVDVPVRN